MALDDTDTRLLALLQTDARMPTAELARRLGLARTTVVSRLARLQRSGVIAGFALRLGAAERPAAVMAHVGIAVEPRRGRLVALKLQALPELSQLYTVSGEHDLIAVLRAPSTERLDALLDEIGETEGVRKTTTSVVLAVRVDRS